MKKLLLVAACAVMWIGMLTPSLQAQGNFDWEELWVRNQPLSPNVTDHWKWMAGLRTYTGLAYDPTRDLLYIVNPGLRTVGGNTYGDPHVHIWDANTGNPKLTQGRNMGGQGGELPVPPDTILAYPYTGWPNGTYFSFSQGQFPLYKIDVDANGRIFVCNIVSPVWGLCYPGPPPNCDPDKLIQGPFRIYRWDTPKSTPRRVYATLNAAHTSTSGTPTNTEQKWSRWGDVMDVVGGLGTIIENGQPKTVDSVRILVSGGSWTGETYNDKNDEINVILAEDRPEASRVSDGLGRKLEYRLAIRLFNGGYPPNNLPLRSSHGIAATGPTALHEIWHDTNGDAQVTLNNQGQDASPFPQARVMGLQHALSSDMTNGTGPSGPLAYFRGLGVQFLICADGAPSNPSDPTATNYNTRARIMSVSNSGGEYRAPGFGDTPYLGNRNQYANSGVNNYMADVDYKLDPDLDSGGYHMVLFVLQTNNGIAAYRSRARLVPVEMQTFNGQLNGDNVDLSWKISSELNNSGWQIQRSFDGGNAWETISFVQGRGTSMQGKIYGYADPVTETHKAIGIVKYRLIQIDNDGRKTYSHAVEVYMNESTAGTFSLLQNFPNPFNPTTTIGFQLRNQAFVTLKVFNQIGEEVATLVNETREAGVHNVSFDASSIPSGTYIYQITVDGKMQQKKMVVMK